VGLWHIGPPQRKGSPGRCCSPIWRCSRFIQSIPPFCFYAMRLCFWDLRLFSLNVDSPKLILFCFEIKGLLKMKKRCWLLCLEMIQWGRQNVTRRCWQLVALKSWLWLILRLACLATGFLKGKLSYSAEVNFSFNYIKCLQGNHALIICIAQKWNISAFSLEKNHR